MTRLLPNLKLDLLIEQHGHQVRLTGSGSAFLATFPTLASLLHFAKLLWPFRHHRPANVSLRIQWGWLNLPLV